MKDDACGIERDPVTSGIGWAKTWLGRIVDDEAARWTFGIFLTVRVGLSALAILIITLRPLPVGGHEAYLMSVGLRPVSGRAQQVLLEVWQRWDVVHYQRIAEQGYTDVESSAFPPFFPALIKTLAPAFGGNYLLAALVVGNASYLAALFIFYKLIRLDHEREVARRATLYLSIFPTAFFFLVPYSESVFFLLVVSFFYAVRNQRCVGASVVAGLASFTRLQGLVLIVPLGYVWLRNSNFNPSRAGRLALLILPVLLPPAVFVWFRHLAGYPSLGSVLTTYWHTTVGLPWKNFANLADLWVANKASAKDFLDLVITVPFLLLTLACLAKTRIYYGLYTASTLLLVTSMVYGDTPLLMNLPRHWLLLFPTFILMGVLGRRSYVHRCVVYTSIPLLLLSTGMFVQWLWVA
jgi:hypothetical protein